MPEQCQMLVRYEYCRRKGFWRPANIPMPAGVWFCKQHATQIAHEQGVWGIYHRNRLNVVEERA